ncbi:MAG: NADH:ubiquinone oxidoreductase [Betaproteobacteria bacterium]|nr:NADH:ubiquinone oxidoreductase [Betaproteobacteria bacterium]
MPMWTWFGIRRGKVTTGWPDAAGPTGQDGVLGLPRLDASKCRAATTACTDCVAACPSEAIVARPGEGVGLDYARCVGCQICTEICPEAAFGATHDWAFGVRSRDDLQTFGGDAGNVAESGREAQHARELVGFGKSLHIRHVDAGSCNGCESELTALLNPFYNLHRLGIFFTPSPRFADLLLVTGPVSAAMREPLLRTWEAMPQPRWVMALGTCATGGGTNGGGYSCHNGLEGLLPVDIWLPGCPPNPAAIIEALLLLLQRRPQRVHGGRHES